MRRFASYLLLNVMLSSTVSAQLETNLTSSDLLRPGVIAAPIAPGQLARLNAVIDQGVQLPLPQALQAALDSARVLFNITGVSAAMIIPNYGMWLGTSGYSYPSVHDTITQDMVFGIASHTKTFIAATMLQLQEEGVLTLEDPLHKWLPTARQDQYRFIDSNITIRQLLNHTSGIWDYLAPWSSFASMLQANPNKVWSPEDILSTFVRAPNFAPGTSFSYSNTNYILAGMIIKAATHSTVSAQLHSRFLDPLNLDDTFLAVEDSIPGPRARPWGDFYWGTNRQDLSGYSDNQHSLSWTAGGMFSRPENMARWAYNLYGGKVLHDSSLRQMLTFTPQSAGFYGLGAITGVVEGHRFVGHTGRWLGYDSETAYCLAARLPVALTYNCNIASGNLTPIGIWLYPILFSVYLHRGSSHAELVTPSRPYFPPGGDTVVVQARVANPNGHPLTVRAYFEAGGKVRDSSLCYDDGLHQDSAASDGIWGTNWAVPPEEAFFTIRVSTYDTIDTTRLDGLGFFTTAGPVRCLGDTSASHVKAWGQELVIGLKVVNRGATSSVPAVVGTIRALDTASATILWGDPFAVGDLEPGFMRISSDISLSFAASQKGQRRLPFELRFYSRGIFCWGDTLWLEVTDPTGVPDAEAELPGDYHLAQNFPNPFNPMTKIDYALPHRSYVTLTVYNTLGQIVATLVHGEVDAGYHSVQFDGSGLASGVYFYRMQAGDFVQSRKLLLVK